MNIKETVSRVFRRDGESDQNDGAAEAPDALELIHSDHEEVNTLFEQALNDKTPSAQRRKATAQILQALTVHAEMEEQIFYPALRKAGGREDRDMLLEAYEEHGVVKDLIAKIEAIRGRDETLKAKLTVLKELVQHHVKEEESEIFGEARKRLGDKRLDALGAEMQRFKDRRMSAASRNGKSGGRKTAARKTTARKTKTRAQDHGAQEDRRRGGQAQTLTAGSVPEVRLTDALVRDQLLARARRAPRGPFRGRTRGAPWRARSSRSARRRGS